MRTARAEGKRTSRTTPPGPAPELLELIEISRSVGGDPDLVQGGGGNTSVKSRDSRTIFVKASGTPLAGMDTSRGWAEMDLPALRALLDRDGLAALPGKAREAEVIRLLQSAVLQPGGARPSVESSLHAILDRVVIHLHPVHLNAFLCSLDSRETYGSVVDGVEGPPLYVPYVDPGYTLAARLSREIEDYRAEHGRLPAIVLLENHGVFIGASEPGPCLDLARRVVERGRAWTGLDRVNPTVFAETVFAETVSPRPQEPEGSGAPGISEVRGALVRGGCPPLLVRRDESPIARELVASHDLVNVARQGAFTPDQIVYCRTYPLVLDAAAPDGRDREVSAYREKHGVDPRVILVPRGKEGSLSAGIYHAAPDVPQLRVVGEVYRAAVAAIVRNDRGAGPRFLNRQQAGFIESWEVEHYRAALLGGARSRFSGRIAAVTGAASGLGKGIALGLVEAGCTVFAFDINAQALEAVRETVPGGKYLPIVADVTAEESVDAAFRAIEESAGGLDFLVNAAGIAPPYPLVSFPLNAWKKALDINLTGYFLCARAAARLLLRQGAGGSIVNLTSKSGLEASKDNSVYNATKAGEIHLMRGWALELGRAGIRVNCVAPGNVFKGSQIWNPEYIRAAAKKKGIRPEEVIPYYNSLTALGLEIEPEDISNAVNFLLSDEARRITGQTLVVDGGQVLVR